MTAPIIHQIWHPFSCSQLPRDWERFARGWRSWHPQYRYVLWGPAESRAFVAERFPDLLALYDGYDAPMKRVAALRYLLLDHFGGMVVDLDLECLRCFESLVAERPLVLAREPAPRRRLAQERKEPPLFTAFLASEAGHPFWTEVLAALRRSAALSGVDESTGKLLLTECFQRYPDRESISVLAPEALSPMDAPSCRDGSAYDVEHWLRSSEQAFAVHHWADTWSRPGPSTLPAPRPYPHGLPARIQHPSWRSRGGRLLEDGPLVSCLMLTKGWSSPARWAIEAFRYQRYQARELVIVSPDQNGGFESCMESLRDPRIRLLKLGDPLLPAGAQRDHAVARARGEFICCWEDTDLHGADRLGAAMTAIQEMAVGAAFLERIGLWWPAGQQYAITSRGPWQRTLVAHRGLFPRLAPGDGPEGTRALDALLARHPVALLDDPNLYTQVVCSPGPPLPAPLASMLDDSTLRVDGPDYERALSVLNKHGPVLEYLAWIEEDSSSSTDR